MQGKPTGKVRIIGGRWKRRQLRVAPVEGLRPTPDRVRETVFNWLAPVIDGASCLDLFAGTGVLGFEAASRGAARVVMVEWEPVIVRCLREQASLLAASSVQIFDTDAMTWIETSQESFDVVFLDPPFQEDVMARVCTCLEQGKSLSSGAFVYLELPSTAPVPRLPETWYLTHDKTAGRVRYYLARRR